MDPIQPDPLFHIPEMPTYPGYPSSKGVGEQLFHATEHFLCWVIANGDPNEHRDTVRNLARIVTICRLNYEGKFINGIEEKKALGVLQHLTTGLETNDETWDDIKPATELMLDHLETTNSKSHLIGLTLELQHAFHDHTDTSEELGSAVRKLIDRLRLFVGPSLSRDDTVAINALLEAFLKQTSWNLQALGELEVAINAHLPNVPPDALKG